MKTDIKGCSTCPAGQERYETFFTPSGRPKIQYDYRCVNGELFSCIADDLDDARAKRDRKLTILMGGNFG